jgi:hypothetical protein
MIAYETLEKKGWTRHDDQMRFEHDGFEFYFIFLGNEKYNFGVLEDEDDHTPMFEGKIKDEAMLDELFSLSIYHDELGEHEPFELVEWLRQRGWKGDEDDECMKPVEDAEGMYYVCTSMGDSDFIITIEDIEAEEGETYLYNGSVLNEAQAEMILKGIGC